MEEINIENTVDLIHKKQAVFFSSQITCPVLSELKNLKSYSKQLSKKKKRFTKPFLKTSENRALSP